jgi:hypothetical protein
MKKFLLLALSFCLLAPIASAQSPYTPRPGSAERAAIMDAIRPLCERDLKQKVIFKVQHLRVARGFALARVVPLKPNGGEINYSRTKYADELAEGAFDGEGEALLRNDDGEWTLLEWRFGASDTEVPIWLARHGAPRSLQ